MRSKQLSFQRMIVLFFNIASHAKSVAICTEKEVLSALETDEQVSDADLVQHIEEALKNASLEYKNLTHIACVIGPGGFTSLRIAVAAANTLADQLQIPQAGIHLCDLLKAQSKEEDVLWIHSTKKDQLFLCGEQWKEPTLLNVDELPTLKSEYWVGECITEHEQFVKHMKPAILIPLKEVLPKFLSSLSYTTGIIQPWYGRGF